MGRMMETIDERIASEWIEKQSYTRPAETDRAADARRRQRREYSGPSLRVVIAQVLLLFALGCAADWALGDLDGPKVTSYPTQPAAARPAGIWERFEAWLKAAL